MDRRAIALTLALLLCASSGWARGLGVLALGGVAASNPAITPPAIVSYSTAWSSSVESTSITIDNPTGSGGVLVAIFSAYRTPTCTGWSVVGTNGVFKVLSKTASSGDPSSYEFDHTVGYGYAHGIILRISGSSSVSRSAEEVDGDWTSTLSFPEVTVSSSGSLLLWIGSKDAEGASQGLSTISSGDVIYSGTGKTYAYSLLVAAADEVSAGVVNNSGTLSASVNGMTSMTIMVTP